MGHFLCVVRIGGGGYDSYWVGIGILNTLKLVGSPTSPAGCLEKTTQDQLSRVARSVLGWLQCVVSKRNSGKSGEKHSSNLHAYVQHVQERRGALSSIRPALSCVSTGF